MRQRSRIKLAVVTPFFPLGTQPYRGRSTYQLVRALQSHFDIRVICPVPRYPKFLQPKRFDYRPIDPSYRPGEVDVEYIDYLAIPLLSRPFNAGICMRYIESPLRAFAPDIVLSYWLYPQGRAAVLAAKRLGIPAIVGAIGSDLNRIPDPIIRMLDRRTMLQADRVITKSAALRQQAIEMGIPESHVTVVCNGRDPELFRLGDRQVARSLLKVSAEERVVLFVGRLDPLKGVRELLAACRQLRDRRPKLRLVMVGDGRLLHYVEKFRQQDGAGWITLTGACTPAEVARWLAASDLLTLPSYAEGCPNVIVEALNCGRPVVATDIPGISELVTPSCGILVPPRQVVPLADALDIALTTIWDENRIAVQFGRTWTDVAWEIQDIILRVLKSSESAVLNPVELSAPATPHS